MGEWGMGTVYRGQKSTFPPQNRSRIGIDGSQKVLDFDHFGEILDLFRGGSLLFVSTVGMEIFVKWVKNASRK